MPTAMSRADECRANAAECEKKAKATKNVEAQRIFREAAVEWRTLGDYTERQQRDY